MKLLTLIGYVFVATLLLAGCYGAAEKAKKLEILLAAEGPAPAKPEAATENDQGAHEWGMNHLGLAEEHFKKAAQIDPKYATAHFNLGVVLDAFGKHQAATEAFKQANALASDVAKIAEADILKHHLKGM